MRLCTNEKHIMYPVPYLSCLRRSDYFLPPCTIPHLGRHIIFHRSKPKQFLYRTDEFLSSVNALLVASSRSSRLTTWYESKWRFQESELTVETNKLYSNKRYPVSLEDIRFSLKLCVRSHWSIPCLEKRNSIRTHYYLFRCESIGAIPLRNTTLIPPWLPRLAYHSRICCT